MFVQSLILTGVLLGTFPGSDKNPVIDDFNDRVQKYWEIHKKAESAAPESDKKKEPDPATIIAHEKATADGIRAARKNAAEGDIFTPAVQKILIRTIKQQLSSGAGAKAREMILGEGNPKSPESESASRVTVQVNANYPPSAPLSTVPPSVLLKLPKLPQGLEYRFVGRHLILFDSKANLIVDIVRNAVR